MLTTLKKKKTYCTSGFLIASLPTCKVAILSANPIAANRGKSWKWNKECTD